MDEGEDTKKTLYNIVTMLIGPSISTKMRYIHSLEAVFNRKIAP